MDSAEIRARTAEARLKDFGEGAPAPAASLLPSAADVFDEVSLGYVGVNFDITYHCVFALFCPKCIVLPEIEVCTLGRGRNEPGQRRRSS